MSTATAFLCCPGGAVVNLENLISHPCDSVVCLRCGRGFYGSKTMTAHRARTGIRDIMAPRPGDLIVDDRLIAALSTGTGQ